MEFVQEIAVSTRMCTIPRAQPIHTPCIEKRGSSHHLCTSLAAPVETPQKSKSSEGNTPPTENCTKSSDNEEFESKIIANQIPLCSGISSWDKIS